MSKIDIKTGDDISRCTDSRSRNPDCASRGRGYTYRMPTQDDSPTTPVRKTVEVTPPVFDPSMVDELPRDEDEEVDENSLDGDRTR